MLTVTSALENMKMLQSPVWEFKKCMEPLPKIAPSKRVKRMCGMSVSSYCTVVYDSNTQACDGHKFFIEPLSAVIMDLSYPIYRTYTFNVFLMTATVDP